MSLVSLFNNALVYPAQGSSSGGASSSSGLPSSPSWNTGASSPSNLPLSSNRSASSTPASSSSQGAAPQAGTEDESDTTYTPAYARLAADAATASATQPVASGTIANVLAETQKHFTDLLARLDTSAQTNDPAAKAASAVSVPSSEAPSTSAARLKTVIAAYAADNTTGRTASFSV